MKEHSPPGSRSTAGATRQQASAAAPSQVQPSLLKGEPLAVMPGIEPLEVEVLEAEESVRWEKFLFFFLPRQRHEFRPAGDHRQGHQPDVDKVDFHLA